MVAGFVCPPYSPMKDGRSGPGPLPPLFLPFFPFWCSIQPFPLTRLAGHATSLYLSWQLAAKPYYQIPCSLCLLAQPHQKATINGLLCRLRKGQYLVAGQTLQRSTIFLSVDLVSTPAGKYCRHADNHIFGNFYHMQEFPNWVHCLS